MTRRIGLLGGTFDPPHLGHLVVAEWVRDELDLDEVRLLVAGDPWMKRGESPVHERVTMAGLAVAGAPTLAVDDRETRRDGPTFTVDTLTALRAEDPTVQWLFLLGADAATSLPQWERVDEAIDLATWVVVDRPDHPRVAHRLSHRLHHVAVPLVDVSSTMIRERVRAGRTVRFLVPDAVAAHIDAHGLYRSDPRL